MPVKLGNDSGEKVLYGRLQLLYEENRRKTFEKWIFSDDKKCNATKLAEAGFYFKDSPDVVQCFLCDKELDGWEEDDNPWSEHLSHASHCTFAKLQKAEKSLTLYQFVDIIVEVFTKTVEEKTALREEEFIKRSRAARKTLCAVKKF